MPHLTPHPDLITLAQRHDLANRPPIGHCGTWARVPDEQVARLLTGALSEARHRIATALAGAFPDIAAEDPDHLAHLADVAAQALTSAPLSRDDAMEALRAALTPQGDDASARRCDGPGSHETPGLESREGQDATKPSQGTTGPRDPG